MNSIITFIQRMTRPALPPPLGRWKLDYCNIKLSNKIELSNEDHCGCCGQYAIDKNGLNQKDKSLMVTDVNAKV